MKNSYQKLIILIFTVLSTFKITIMINIDINTLLLSNNVIANNIVTINDLNLLLANKEVNYLAIYHSNNIALNSMNEENILKLFNEILSFKSYISKINTDLIFIECDYINISLKQEISLGINDGCNGKFPKISMITPHKEKIINNYNENPYFKNLFYNNIYYQNDKFTKLLLLDFIQENLTDFTYKINSLNIDNFLSDNSINKVLIFSNKSSISPYLKALSGIYYSRIKFGFVNSSEKDIMLRFRINPNSIPLIKLINVVDKSGVNYFEWNNYESMKSIELNLNINNLTDNEYIQKIDSLKNKITEELDFISLINKSYLSVPITYSGINFIESITQISKLLEIQQPSILIVSKNIVISTDLMAFVNRIKGFYIFIHLNCETYIGKSLFHNYMLKSCGLITNETIFFANAFDKNLSLEIKLIRFFQYNGSLSNISDLFQYSKAILNMDNLLQNIPANNIVSLSDLNNELSIEDNKSIVIFSKMTNNPNVRNLFKLDSCF